MGERPRKCQRDKAGAAHAQISGTMRLRQWTAASLAPE